VAVARDASVLHAAAGDAARTHGERLPSEIVRALAAAGIGIGEIDLLAVASGPGSFTGLRVGIAAIQGLALARGVQVVPVPTLEALIEAFRLKAEATQIGAGGTGIREEGTEAGSVASGFRRKAAIAAWMDGHRGEVFAWMPTMGAPLAAPPAAVLDAWNIPDDLPIVFVGDGAVRYREVIDDRLGSRAIVSEPPLLAPAIARIAFRHPERAVAPHEIVPVYVRRPDAELARERRQAAPEEPRG
jgi:tRNA threonylcarbamoyladenosine biosynthesis protein TsaB